MKILAASLIGLLASQEALAIMRCGGRLIEPEQSLYEVNQKCGDPASVERRTTWRMQTFLQQQCQTIMEPAPYVPGSAGMATSPRPIAAPRQVCTAVPFSYSVPVDEEIWYFDDTSVPKALHFENGRLIWIESLWHLRH